MVREQVSGQWIFPSRHVGRRVLVYDSLPSTNTTAAALAGDPSHAGTAVLALEQTAGRGQYGRSWHSPPGLGVWLSVIVPPAPAARRPAVLTAWAAVAVADVVSLLTGADGFIKWPNDVLLGGKKVCGILIEQGRGTVAGIGLNVNQTREHLSAAGLPDATSLALAASREFDRDDVARTLLAHLDAGFDTLARGDLEGLEAAWRSYLALEGEAVTVVGTGGAVTSARVRRLALTGVDLELPTGSTTRLAPESIQNIRREPAGGIDR